MKQTEVCLVLAAILFTCLAQDSLAGESMDRFFDDVEHLIANHGTEPSKWPDCAQKNHVRDFLMLNYQRGLEQCEFANNMLGLGVFHGPADAEADQIRGSCDASGIPYDRIVASSPDGNMIRDVVRSIGNNLGQPMYNTDLNNRLIIARKCDVHSQDSDVVRNFNGKSFQILAREVNIMGAPGSAYPGYEDDIAKALVGSSQRIHVWVGDKDTVTRLPSKMRSASEDGLLGLKVVIPWEVNSRPVDRPTITIIKVDCNHARQNYQTAMREYAITHDDTVARDLLSRVTLPENYAVRAQGIREYWCDQSPRVRTEANTMASMAAKSNPERIVLVADTKEAVDAMRKALPNHAEVKVMSQADWNKGGHQVTESWKADIVLGVGVRSRLMDDDSGPGLVSSPPSPSAPLAPVPISQTRKGTEEAVENGVSMQFDVAPSSFGKDKSSELDKKRQDILKNRPNRDSLSWPSQGDNGK